MLVCAGGLFNRIRYPIYLSGVVPYTAFAVYPAIAVSLGLRAVAIWALHRLAERKDAEMAKKRTSNRGPSA